MNSGVNGRRVFGVTGWKNAGKTTLVERLVAEFVRRGWRIATIKHAHHDVDIDQRDLGGAGRAMTPGIGATPIDVDVVMGMLDGGDTPASPHEFRDQPLDERGLAGILPAGDAEDATTVHATIHDAMIRSAWA